MRGVLAGGGGGGSSGIWSDIFAPVGNLSLSMAAHKSTFTYNAATGAENLFNLTDTVNNAGTGYLFNATTATGSTLKPFHVSAAGNEALVVLANGNVGVGTISPEYKLDIAGTLRFQPTTTPLGNKGAIYYDSAADKFRCYQAGQWLDCIGSSGGGGGSNSPWVDSGTAVTLLNINEKVGIGANNPEFKLSLAGDGGILALGAFGSGTDLITSSSGTRMIWYPKKAAFRAGFVNDSQWNDINIGNYSAAFGNSSTASGLYSFASGYLTTASGTGSFAGGVSSQATGTRSLAFGNSAIAGGAEAIALGANAEANGGYSFAVGNYSMAGGTGSIALGQNSESSGISAFALGDSVLASGNYSLALGKTTTASGVSSTASGDNTSTAGDYSWVGGKFMQLTDVADGTFVWGQADSAQSITASNSFLLFPAGTPGNVGIGTPNPSQKLQVVGKIQIGTDTNTATAGAIEWSGTNFRGYNGSSWTLLDAQPSGSAGGWTDDGSIVRLSDGSDKVGIGTVVPEQKLSINGAIQVGDASGTIDVSDTGTIRWNGSNFQGWNGSAWLVLDIQAPSGGGWTEDAVNNYVYVSNTGRNIGIGTVAPSYKLDIQGGDINMSATNFLRIAGVNGLNGQVLTRTTTGMTWQNLFPTGVAGQTLRYSGSDWIANSFLYNNGSNIGINTTAPGQMLTVAGKIQIGNDAIAPTAGTMRWNGSNFQGYDGFIWINLDESSGAGAGWTRDGGAGVVKLTASGDSVAVGVDATGFKFDVAGTVHLRGSLAGTGLYVNSSSNVGIGTASPNQKLSVAGTFGIREGGASPSFYTIFQGGDQIGDITYTLPIGQGGVSTYLKNNGGGELSWETPVSGAADDAGAVQFNTTGSLAGDDVNFFWDNTVNKRLGLGTNAPAARLQVVGGAIMPAVGNSAIGGFYWPVNPGGGGGDEAYIRYYAEVGENTKLLIGTGNDSDDDISFYQNGGERLTIYNSNVGIGTTIPSYKLSIVDSGVGLDRPASNVLSFYTDNAERMRIDATGNVGIGTGSVSVDDKLHIIGQLRIDNNIDTVNRGCVRYNGTSNQLEYANDCSSFVAFSSGGGGGGGWVKAGTVVQLDVSTDNVGIGTVSPNQKLSVAGTFGIREGGAIPSFYTIFQGGDQTGDITYTLPIGQGGASTYLKNNGSGELSWANISSNAWVLGGNASPGSNFLGTTTANDLIIVTNNLERIRVESAGNVGIGTTPSYKLDVNGVIRTGRNGLDGQLRIYSEQGVTDWEAGFQSNSAMTENTIYTLPSALSAGSNYVLISNTLGELSWGPVSAGGVEWSSLANPSGSLGLNMGIRNTVFQWQTGTGSNDLFTFTTDASANGTGSLVNIQTGVGSTVLPLRVRAGSTEALSVNSAGNVGIGATLSGQKLSVAGNLGITGTFSILEGGASPSFYTIFQGGDQTGNIIYTLPTNDGSANQVLRTDGDGLLSWVDVTATNAWGLTGNSGTLPATNFLGTTDLQPLIMKTNSIERMRILGTGEIGIGSAVSGVALNVNGTIRTTVFQLGTSATSGYVLTSDSGGVGTWQAVPSSSGGWTDDGTAVRLTTITDSVGIGTATPENKLTVRSDLTGAIVSLLRLENLGTAAINTAGKIDIVFNRTTGGATIMGTIEGTALNIDNTYYSGKMELKTASDGVLTTMIEVGNPNIVFNRPISVNAGGDVGMDYDLVFMNTGTSNITSEGPLMILAGDSNHAENLTLSTQSNVAVGDSGVATAGAATTLTDSTKTWIVDAWINGTVSIISGPGAGQTQTITDNDATSITVVDWDTILGDPAVNSIYQLTYIGGGDVIVNISNSNLSFGGFKILGNDNGSYALRVTPDGNVEIGGNGSGASDLIVKQNLFLTGGNIKVNQLASPSNLACSQRGTTGGNIYELKVTAYNENGETSTSGQCQVANGNSTLTSANYIELTWNPVPGVVGYKIYSCAGSGCSEVLDDGIVVAPNVLYKVDDMSFGSVAYPTTNTTGGTITASLYAPAGTLDQNDIASVATAVGCLPDDTTHTHFTGNLTALVNVGDILQNTTRSIQKVIISSATCNGGLITEVQHASISGNTVADVYDVVAPASVDLGSWANPFRDVYARKFFGTNIDVAEIFTVRSLDNMDNSKGQLPSAGDVVVLDLENSETMVMSSASYQSGIVGVISTDPGLLLGGTESETQKPVALTGRVPVKVNLENGEIKIGDALTSSSVNGVAMKATEPGQIAGFALESFNGTETQCEMKEIFDQGTESIQQKRECSSVDVEESKILSFISPRIYLGALDKEGNVSGEEAGLTDGIKKAPVLSQFSLAIKNGLEKLGLFVENGVTKVKEITANKARLDKIEMVDQATGEVYCTWIANGEWVKIKSSCEDLPMTPTSPTLDTTSTPNS